MQEYTQRTQTNLEKEMLTLVLVVGLCSDVGCLYDDVTSRFDIKSDAECAQIANYGNDQNRINRKDPRFACLEPHVYQTLKSREL